jgi:hypothetical protein
MDNYSDEYFIRKHFSANARTIPITTATHPIHYIKGIIHLRVLYSIPLTALGTTRLSNLKRKG